VKVEVEAAAVVVGPRGESVEVGGNAAAAVVDVGVVAAVVTAVGGIVGPVGGLVAAPDPPQAATSSEVKIGTICRARRPGAPRLPATTAYGSGVAAIRSRVHRMSAVLLVALLGAACGGAGSKVSGTAADRPTTTVGASSGPTSTGPTSSGPTSTGPPPSSAAPTTGAPATAPEAAPAPPAPATTTAPFPMGLPELDRAGDSGQAVVVTAAGYGTTTATLTTWERTAGGWQPVHGPWAANLGRAGFAPPGEKREGDGRTPSGSFAIGFLFGVEPDPGVAMPYRRVTPSVVWDDDPSSPAYNLWVDGGRGEAMYQSPAYDHGAVIAYNTARTPGLGSAIFLHVSTGGPTAGCVSLPVERLVDVLRWLAPTGSPVILMGVA